MIQTKNLEFSYHSKNGMKFPDISLDQEEDLVIIGDSGKGKTTLLKLLSLLLKPLSGEIFINNTAIHTFSEREKDNFRRKHIGLVFQKSNFIQSLSLIENIQAKILFSKSKVESSAIKTILEDLGIADLMHQRMFALSEGQKQRASIALAVINNPSIILADEPTSSLDDTNSRKVINLLKATAKRSGSNLILVTHDKRIVPEFSKMIEL
ncbi:putative ABC transport system ATP-binding protein [Mesonia phycicola]|uniref:Putative ABC transport system ATP-binding protein n=1 Tax=Mesonia phycicola TaxID=579105 RepID=A0A1M6A6Q7_9FLAO|nr:ATP-binding cassette domain-containing protein [Mesonia phycicola]SHI32125.1 putative ABC transport system ATP-binding protein [Mesonia phycicola]